MIQTTIPCRNCDEPMIEIEFSKHWRLQCVNPKCELTRECQGNREKPINLGPITTFMPAPLPALSHRKEKKQKKRSNRIEKNRIEGNRRGYNKRLQKNVTKGYKQ